jgi:hypothetical protein
MVDIVVRQANTFSDFVSHYIEVRDENRFLKEELERIKDDVACTKASKDKVEVKASKKDMEEKVKVASTQFKVMDLNIGKDFADRKAITEAAKAAIQNKVRSDLRKDYDDKIKAATFRVLARNTHKRNVEGQDIWTAPVLVTIPDRESRWQVEDHLRKSKVNPGFHWPREMVDNIKAYRGSLARLGVSETDNFIRIRPEERDSVWKIRADAKPKSGNSRFVPVASFDMPPLYDNLKVNMPSWATPTWTKQGIANNDRPLADELTDEDIMYNL